MIPADAVQIKAPVLLITATEDPIGLASGQVNSTQPFSKNFRVKPIASGHFVQVEASEETNEALDQFFVEVLKNSTA